MGKNRLPHRGHPFVEKNYKSNFAPLGATLRELCCP
jgi:hypothetical protein